MGGSEAAAAELVEALKRSGLTVATAESLTGGLVAGALAGIPGASLVLRGGVVAYQESVKQRLLGVSAELLASRGAVDPDVAAQLARGAAAALDADLALATTGAAGPDPVGEAAPGTGFLALALPSGEVKVRAFGFTGTRNQVREQVTAEVLRWALLELNA